MAQLLHIVTKPEDSLAVEIISCQKTDRQHHVEIIDLTSQKPDYKSLLKKIFEADCIQVW
jgi:hypothetical protein